MFRTLASLLLVASLVAAAPPQTVSVMYAGSLVTVMEGAIAQGLAHEGITFEGEPRGSTAIANLILGGLRKPDAIVVVDPAVVARLSRAGLIAQSWPLGSATLGIGWTQNSRFARRLAHVARTSAALCALLATPGIRIARTDPQLDPKGRYTLQAVAMLCGSARARQMLGGQSQVFPEESLLVRLETGGADAGFVYSTEASARHLSFIPLPGRASMSRQIRYELAVMTNPPHPAAARAFAQFLLTGKGRRILNASGLSPSQLSLSSVR